MRKLRTILPEFVEFVPEALESGVLYISVQYKTMAHLCCCGCGKKVVTPISPTGWEFTFNGRAVSISPSVGNWNLKCQSHYVIDHSRVEWASRWSKESIAAGFARDRQAKQDYYQRSPPQRTPTEAPSPAPTPSTAGGLLRRLKAWWYRR